MRAESRTYGLNRQPAPPEQPGTALLPSDLPNGPARRPMWCDAMRRKHHRRYQGCFTRLANLARSFTAPAAAGLLLALATLLVIMPAQGNAQEPCPGGGFNPTPTAVTVTTVPIVVVSTTDDYFVLYVSHEVVGTTGEIPVLIKRGAAHEWLWRALRGKGIKVQVVAIGLDFDDTIRSETALKRWSKGAGKQVEQIAEGQTQDDPDVKAEMQLIENAILKLDARFMAKYGGVQAASRRLLALRKLPKSKVESEAAIDSYEIWVSSRLRMLDVDL